jgi:hypothetical protein
MRLAPVLRDAQCTKAATALRTAASASGVIPSGVAASIKLETACVRREGRARGQRVGDRAQLGLRVLRRQPLGALLQ